MNNLITCKNMCKSVGKYRLEDINFALSSGYILGVIGRNGSGKTTLLRSLMGSYKPEGDTEISIAGTEMRKDIRVYKSQLAYVLSDTPFDKSFTAGNNGKIYGSYYKSFDMDKYLSLLKEFDISEKSILSKLSKGQQIKQQLAFALSYDAKVYFFDEPTGNLDVEFREQFYGYVREIVSTGNKSVIYAGHLIEEMESMADYILWLESDEETGRMKFFGDIDELKEGYRIIEGDDMVMEKVPGNIIVGGRKRESHQEVLVRYEEKLNIDEKYYRYADLKEIMYYVEKGKIL